MWPDAEIEDEDEQVEAIVEAYSAETWDLEALEALLERGGRRRRRKRKAKAVGPQLLREFIARCDARGVGCMLAEGQRFAESDQAWFEVLWCGNGDAYLCDGADPAEAFFVDHEALFERSGSVDLGRLLAAWLFHDEIVARELEEHPDVEAHALELCDVAPGMLFTRIPL